MKPKKTIYYSDPINDDFAELDLKSKPVPADFPFAITNPFWRILEFFMYRIVALPIIWLISKAGYGLRIKNRRALRKLRKTGYYLYGNHTQSMMDAYSPALVTFPKFNHVVVGPPAVASAALRIPVQFFGGIPIPDGVKGKTPFMQALSLRIDQKRTVTIYPEAHIWPWYTGIRPFSDASFEYPVRDGVPAVAFVTTYRERKIFRGRSPRLTVTVSEPFYPDLSLGRREARKKLRDEVYGFMRREASRPGNCAFYEYIQRENSENEKEGNDG